MDIIFLGTTGVHHTLVAAHIYLEKLHDEEYDRIEGFADHELEEAGFPIYVGHDRQGNRIYSLGGGQDLGLAEKSIRDLTAILGYSSRDLLVQPVSIGGDRLLALLSAIPPMLGGPTWSKLLAAILIKGQLKAIREQVAALKQGDGLLFGSPV